MKKYFPLLLSKAGEIQALTRLSQNVKDEISPIIQVLPGEYDRVEKFASSQWTFTLNQLFLDFSLCQPFDQSSVRNLVLRLLKAGVNVIPVIQLNSDPRYLALLQSFIANGSISDICIRVSNGGGGFLNIRILIDGILQTLGLNRDHSHILLDFGFVDQHNHNLIAALSVNAITAVDPTLPYRNIIVATGSFLENLGSLAAGRVHNLRRFEWDIWQSVIVQPNLEGVIKYGDYGTKHPIYSEMNFPGSCSIRYTCANEFVVYRGELSGNHPDGNGQYITFADRLVRSSEYYGAAFSYGDAQINFYAGQVLANPNRKTGNATNWVEISQNHHVTLLHSLL